MLNSYCCTHLGRTGPVRAESAIAMTGRATVTVTWRVKRVKQTKGPRTRERENERHLPPCVSIDHKAGCLAGCFDRTVSSHIICHQISPFLCRSPQNILDTVLVSHHGMVRGYPSLRAMILHDNQTNNTLQREGPESGLHVLRGTSDFIRRNFTSRDSKIKASSKCSYRRASWRRIIERGWHLRIAPLPIKRDGDMRKAKLNSSMIPYAVTEWTRVVDRSPPHSSTIDSNFGQIPMGHDMSVEYCGTTWLPLYVDTAGRVIGAINTTYSGISYPIRSRRYGLPPV